MINKKRQELLINNLRSISSEVRQRSLEQLLQIPTLPADEKMSYIEIGLKDDDEKVRANAEALLKEHFPENATQADLPQQPAAPLQPPTPLPNVTKTQDGDLLKMPDLDNLQNSDAAVLESASPPVLNDPVSSELPDLTRVKDVQALMQHIHELVANKPQGHLTQLLQMAKSVQEEVALAALQALLNLKDRLVPPQVLFMLSNEGFSSQRRFLMLKIILDTDILLDSHLLERILINEKDVIVKSGLVKVFARNSGARGVNTLIACLQDEDPRVRANTVEVIEEQKIKGCEQHILQLLQDSENRVKVNAAKYLVKNGYQQAFLTLRSMLVSSEVWLRDSVIFALGEIGDQASLTLLKAALKDPNQGIRLSVLKSLAKINNSTSRQVLKAAAGDPDPIVAQVANSLWEKIKDTPMSETTKIPAQPAVPQPQPQPQPQPPTPTAQPAVPQPPTPTPSGAPAFAKPRSAEIYARLCGEDPNGWRSAARDIAFVMGDDQLLLVEKAYNHADENVRLAAAKILSRKRNPEAREILQKMANDPNELVRSLVEKTLLINK
jgi:HEAT repeat protein